MKTKAILAITLVSALAASTQALTAPKMKMTTGIPPQITTPDSVETRIGTLKFFDGFPDDETAPIVLRQELETGRNRVGEVSNSIERQRRHYGDRS